MFRKKTVLVLGAGASWHYNYPTGEELLEEIISNCEMFLKIIEQQEDGVFEESLVREINLLGGHASINKFLNKIKIQHPINIDSFLRLNKNEQDFGKFIITYSLLRCEHKDRTEQIVGLYKKKSSDEKCNLTNSNEIKGHLSKDRLQKYGCKNELIKRISPAESGAGDDDSVQEMRA